METQKATIRLSEGLWYAETEDGKRRYILGQHPEHQTLTIGRDEGRQAKIEVFDGPGGLAAEFKQFV